MEIEEGKTPQKRGLFSSSIFHRKVCCSSRPETHNLKSRPHSFITSFSLKINSNPSVKIRPSPLLLFLSHLLAHCLLLLDHKSSASVNLAYSSLLSGSLLGWDLTADQCGGTAFDFDLGEIVCIADVDPEVLSYRIKWQTIILALPTVALGNFGCC